MLYFLAESTYSQKSLKHTSLATGPKGPIKGTVALDISLSSIWTNFLVPYEYLATNWSSSEISWTNSRFVNSFLLLWTGLLFKSTTPNSALLPARGYAFVIPVEGWAKATSANKPSTSPLESADAPWTPLENGEQPKKGSCAQ